MAVGFQHPAVKVHIGDGFEFLKNYKDTFDVIITDSYHCSRTTLISGLIRKDQPKVFSRSHISNYLRKLFVMAALSQHKVASIRDVLIM